MKPVDYLGDATLEKMKGTKWYVLARMLEDLLYNSSIEEDIRHPSIRKFVAPNKAYVGIVPNYIHIMGHEGSYVETEKGLRELVHECERMAVKEVT